MTINDAILTVNTQYLRSGRNLEVPFRVLLESNSSPTELVCNKIMRIIPGKRLMCVGEWDKKPVAVKIFLSFKSARRHCNREIKGITALKNAGIKTPALLLQGNLQKDNTPALIFQRVIPALNPHKVFDMAETDEKRSELLKRIAVVIAEQHAIGLKQRDLHLGNFLISNNDIYTIDGDTVDTDQIETPLSKAMSLSNLGLFLAQLNPNFDHLFAAVFQAYTEKRSWAPDSSLFNHLLKEIKLQRKNRSKKYLYKIFRKCTAFVCYKSWSSYMLCDRNLYYGEMKKLLSAPDATIGSSRLLKDGNSATVALAEANGKLLAIKRYNIKNLRHALKRCPRNTRAWSSWLNAHRLELLGIPTPKPIAFLERRWGPFRSTSYYISEYIDGTDLYSLIKANRAKKVTIETFSRKFGKILRLLINASMSHGDFKASNFIVAGEKLYLIDIEGVRKHSFKWSLRKAIKRDCLRFIKNWQSMPEFVCLLQNQIRKIKL